MYENELAKIQNADLHDQKLLSEAINLGIKIASEKQNRSALFSEFKRDVTSWQKAYKKLKEKDFSSEPKSNNLTSLMKLVKKDAENYKKVVVKDADNKEVVIHRRAKTNSEKRHKYLKYLPEVIKLLKKNKELMWFLNYNKVPSDHKTIKEEIKRFETLKTNKSQANILDVKNLRELYRALKGLSFNNTRHGYLKYLSGIIKLFKDGGELEWLFSNEQVPSDPQKIIDEIDRFLSVMPSEQSQAKESNAGSSLLELYQALDGLHPEALKLTSELCYKATEQYEVIPNFVTGEVEKLHYNNPLQWLEALLHNAKNWRKYNYFDEQKFEFNKLKTQYMAAMSEAADRTLKAN